MSDLPFGNVMVKKMVKRFRSESKKGTPISMIMTKILMSMVRPIDRAVRLQILNDLLLQLANGRGDVVMPISLIQRMRDELTNELKGGIHE